MSLEGQSERVAVQLIAEIGEFLRRKYARKKTTGWQRGNIPRLGFSGKLRAIFRQYHTAGDGPFYVSTPLVGTYFFELSRKMVLGFYAERHARLLRETCKTIVGIDICYDYSPVDGKTDALVRKILSVEIAHEIAGNDDLYNIAMMKFDLLEELRTRGVIDSGSSRTSTCGYEIHVASNGPLFLNLNGSPVVFLDKSIALELANRAGAFFPLAETDSWKLHVRRSIS